jgi:hypothetical protein
VMVLPPTSASNVFISSFVFLPRPAPDARGRPSRSDGC